MGEGWVKDGWKSTTSETSTELGEGVEADEPEVKHLYQDEVVTVDVW